MGRDGRQGPMKYAAHPYEGQRQYRRSAHTSMASTKYMQYCCLLLDSSTRRLDGTEGDPTEHAHLVTLARYLRVSSTLDICVFAESADASASLSINNNMHFDDKTKIATWSSAFFFFFFSFLVEPYHSKNGLR